MTFPEIDLSKAIPAQKLVELAQDATGISEFDNDSWRQGLEVLVTSMRVCGAILPSGFQRMNRRIVEHLARRLEISEWRRTHPEVAAQEIVAPVFVFGMPRTGTTLLINLLDQDPKRRTMLKWSLYDPVPPPEAHSLRTDPRCLAQVAAERAELVKGVAGANIRFEFSDGPTECVMVMAHDFRSLQWDGCAPMPAYSDMMFHGDMTGAYEWHRRVLQHMQSRAPGTWALKGPSHGLWLETLLKVYPDARLVWTHRDPFVALASLCKLIANAQRRNCAEADIDYLRDYLPWYIAEHARRPMKLMEQLGDRLHHVFYDEQVTRPMDVMQGIYQWLGDDLDAGTETAMRIWLEHNPQGMLGRNDYSLEQFGLTRESVAPLFEEYLERFPQVISTVSA